jgi:hypothetical protein
MSHRSLNYTSCYERRYLKAAFTRCKFAHASKEPGMRAQTFQLASKFSLLNFPQFVWNVCVRIPGTWLARANLHHVKATEVHLSPSQSCDKVWWTLLISGWCSLCAYLDLGLVAGTQMVGWNGNCTPAECRYFQNVLFVLFCIRHFAWFELTGDISLDSGECHIEGLFTQNLCALIIFIF